MQIVINIPDEDYEYLKTHNKHGLYSSILNGTPLPKGHGRLIDADALLKKHLEADYDCRITRAGIDHAPAIIEADKEG